MILINSTLIIWAALTNSFNTVAEAMDMLLQLILDMVQALIWMDKEEKAIDIEIQKKIIY